MIETEQMLISLLNCRRVDLYADPAVLTGEQNRKYQDMLLRRRNGEPLQYILGTVDFMGITLKVDRGALIPRPETEILTELAITALRPLAEEKQVKVLDLGTGSGNITVSLAKNIAGSFVTSVELSAEALRVAAGNALANGVSQKINFVNDDMLGFLDRACDREDKFDLIISNPPYVESGSISGLPAEVRYEPPMALDGGEDGLFFYRHIIPKAAPLLERRGFLVMEIGDHQRHALEDIFKPYSDNMRIDFFPDYSGFSRIAVIKWKS